MQFATDNGALPQGATVCRAELHTNAGLMGDDDSRNLIGRYCTGDFPIVEENWTDSFTPDAIAGVPLGSLPPDGGAPLLVIDDLSGITPTAKTGLCLGISGGEPSGTDGAWVASFDTPFGIGPQLWVWFNVPPTP